VEEVDDKEVTPIKIDLEVVSVDPKEDNRFIGWKIYERIGGTLETEVEGEWINIPNREGLKAGMIVRSPSLFEGGYHVGTVQKRSTTDSYYQFLSDSGDTMGSLRFDETEHCDPEWVCFCLHNIGAGRKIEVNLGGSDEK